MRKVIGILAIAIAMQINSLAQGHSPLENLWPVEGTFYVGFDQPLSGTQIEYFPYLEEGSIALYVGENGLYPEISYQTEVVPESHSDDQITFIWQAAIPRTVGDEEAVFRMSVNDSHVMDIHSYREADNPNWRYVSGSYELIFIHSHTSRANGQYFGYMILKAKSDVYSRGQALTIKIENVKSDPSEALSIIQNPVVRKLELFPEAAIQRTANGPRQTARVELTHLGVPEEVVFRIDGDELARRSLHAGFNEINLFFEPVNSIREMELETQIGSGEVVRQSLVLEPVRKFEVYFLPHSHVDIGFTHEQDEVARLQWRNLDLALDLIDSTTGYPEGSQYKWNAEVSWVLDGYLEQASLEQKSRFLTAVAQGSIGIDALYGSVLTGLQREEELFQNTSFSRRIAEQYGFDIRSAMITDVPGYTWGTVPGLKKMGIDYLSVGPNHMPHLPHGGWQVGQTFEVWGDVPFYWVSPDGKDKLLFWMSTHGYSWFHSWSTGNISWAGGTPILNFLDELKEQDYPYDIVQLRYNIGNDNGPPDPEMPGFFKEWNEKYAWPKFKIATTLEMMEEFEERYAAIIPEAQGDFTPYWEDGAASSSTETALNRQTADRIVQAETLTLLQDGPSTDYREHFDRAWTGVVLFSEHTWGALQSKSDPDGEFTKELWRVKKGYGQEAADLAETVLGDKLGNPSGRIDAFHVINTLSWTRSQLVKLPANLEYPGTRIFDHRNKEVPTQVLSTGELAFVARDIPAFASLKYTLKKGNYKSKSSAVQVQETVLQNNLIRMELDAEKGVLNSLEDLQSGRRFLSGDTVGFNSYWYSGHILEDLSRNHSPEFRVVEQGPVVGAIEVSTQGAGANGIRQYFEVVDGLDQVYIRNIVDKQRVVENENVRFSFPFDIPGGSVRMDIPWSILQPGKNQLKGANLNFYSVQRFVDISNESHGITMTTLDAPIWEIGQMSGQFWMTDMDRRPWIKTYESSQTLYAWVMNNAWFVNYKAYQEGEITYRFVLDPHEVFNASEAKKKGMESTMPLLISFDEGFTPFSSPYALSGSTDVIATSLKSSRDGNAMMLRLFNCSSEPSQVNIGYEGELFRSSPLEEQAQPLDNELRFGPWEIVTIRGVPK